MNHELAKELKDAGFPFRKKEHRYSVTQMGASICDDCSKLMCVPDFVGCEPAPTLEELIEACEKFTFTFGLEKHTNDWRAGTLKTGGIAVMATGSTPTEAVAKLWLALRKV